MLLAQIVNWIVVNRKGRAFQDYTISKIVSQLDECIKNRTMLCIVEDDKLLGIICCRKDEEKKVMYVYDILTIRKGIVKQMMQYFLKNYPGYILEGIKKTGAKRQFNNPKRLAERL